MALALCSYFLTIARLAVTRVSARDPRLTESLLQQCVEDMVSLLLVAE